MTHSLLCCCNFVPFKHSSVPFKLKHFDLTMCALLSENIPASDQPSDRGAKTGLPSH